MNSHYKDWGWINGLTDLERDVFKAERQRHDKEMSDGTGEHHAKYSNGISCAHFDCSCGFAWKMDCSG